MAKEQALKFIAYVNSDEGARDKLQAASDNGLNDLVKIARQAGFDFTVEELQAAAVEKLESASQVLSDDTLENIVGGANKLGPTGPIQHKHIAGVKYE